MNIEKYSKKIGTYRYYTYCRFCFNPRIVPVIDLGFTPLAGGFIDKKMLSSIMQKEKFYPLILSFCSNCFLLQTNAVIDAKILFKNYFYHSSSIKTLVNHFENLFEDIKQYINPIYSTNFLVEIGCNDGSVIHFALKKGLQALGVDPATNIVRPLIKKGVPIMNDYFDESVANKIVKKYGKANIIFSSNTLAHIEDMHTVFNGIKHLLTSDGVFIFETHYLGNLIKEFQYDMIYHEHQYYYSLITLRKFLINFGLEIFDIQHIPIHGGSMRYFVQHKKNNKYKINIEVKKLLNEEKKQKFDKVETFLLYNQQIKKRRQELIKLIKRLKGQKKQIVGYGASGRATIIMNYCNLNNNYLDYIVDDAPAKQGNYTPGMHIPIVTSSMLSSKKRPDYVVLFAWSFFKEIKEKNNDFISAGGTFIIPLPKLKLIRS